LAPVHSGSERHRVGGYTASGRVGCWCWSVGNILGTNSQPSSFRYPDVGVSGTLLGTATASSPLKNGACWMEYDRLSCWDAQFFKGILLVSVRLAKMKVAPSGINH